ncbi:alpha/beta hydrolase [Sphingobacterium sp. SRCM116780]|uniref:alpha/beta hydrolase n=1 Tax=Sphingobacterium sp. SRCM116780 TaxID=2907623 RepID=UPI001F1601BF|nr:alpha/beta hydrolase [Sphingobacterium sp. SRCM116780]UIR57781.1 alpha/beta hydrolase [Sphingobacterium sp. SRCM116780]
MNLHLRYLFLVIFISSCGIMHNVPSSQTPNSFVKPNIVNSFVDQNGNFYPDNWRKNYGNPPRNGKKDEYSLMKIATERGITDKLTGFEGNKLKELKEKVKSKKRVFILVHGFNAANAQVNESYSYIQKLIKTNTQDDEIIRFYWDGLSTSNPFGGAKVWFTATSFSQMAGEFGLRRILNAISNKDVYIISHSRGASVVLSALSTPPFNEKFAQETKEIHNVDVDGSKTLLENGNRITCIMLAPAVGLVDFKSKDLHNGDDSFRSFSPQVKKIHITINNTDNTLKKFVGFLSDKLNPTDLGYRDNVYNELIKHYDFFEKTDFSGMKSHEFNRYIRNSKFKTMLKENSISLK